MVDYDDIGGDCTSTCASICTTTTQPSIQVANPIGQGSVSGMLNLQVDITDPTNSIHSVQYLINDEAIETTAIAPYNVDWHSINVFDGIVSLKVIALDIQGEDVTSSDTVLLHVSNHDGYSFSNTSPEFEATVSGDMVMSTLISNTMNGYPDYWPENLVICQMIGIHSCLPIYTLMGNCMAHLLTLMIHGSTCVMRVDVTQLQLSLWTQQSYPMVGTVS